MSWQRQFFEAARSGRTGEMRRLLEAEPTLLHARSEHGKTALHWAAEKDFEEAARLLLDAGAELEALTDWGATALDWAAHLGSFAVGELLLGRGAEGLDLINAASLGRLADVRRLLEVRPWPRRRSLPDEPNRHWPAQSAAMRGDVLSDAFYGACRNGCTEVARLLLERGADVDAVGVFAATALHWAALNGHAQTVEFLIRQGASVRLKDPEFDACPSGWAREGGHEELAARLERVESV